MTRRIAIYYFAFCMFFFSFFASGLVDSLDGFQYLAVARRMYYDHTFALPRESLETKDNIWLTPLPGKNGVIYSPTGLGYSIALLPSVVFEDLFLKITKQQPLSAFPLQSDWPVLLAASMTNSVFGALLAVILFLILKTYGLSNRQAIFVSFVGIVSTNLFVYTKHVMAHMMFLSFLLTTFYFLRKYAIFKHPKYIFFAGLSFGITAVSYNASYQFSIIPFCIYYLLSTSAKISLSTIKRGLRDLLFGAAGFMPFYLINCWFNDVRGVITSTQSTISVVNSYASALFPPAYIVFEGVWNTLISPGRGVFIYSPLVIAVAIFWYKLRRQHFPEIVSFTTLFLIYTYVIGILRHGSDYPIWHGEYSWGPRYMLAVIPFFIILIGIIYTTLTKLHKILVILPLAFLGLWLETIGILLPYQIKFGGLEKEFTLNGNYFNVALYSNIIPRYSAPFVMSKKLIKRAVNLPKVYNHGKYDLRLFDGFEYPFDLGYTKWRGTDPLALISLVPDKDTSQIELKLRNHKIDSKSGFTLMVRSQLNDKEVSKISILPDKEEVVTISLNNKDVVYGSRNIIKIRYEFQNSKEKVTKNKQVVFLQGIKIDGVEQNIETLDFPYYSPISKSLIGSNYYYWGGENINFYDLWDVHSGVFEQTFDLWWLRPYHYWDYPKKLFTLFLVINLSGIALLSYKLRRMLY